MTGRLPEVCLVTPGHVASAPRLVKEAGALAAAGYPTHVVAGRHFPPVDPLDADIFASAAWSHTLVDYRAGLAVSARKLLRKLAQWAAALPAPVSIRVAAMACHAESLRLAAAADRVPAGLYVGHCLAGLPAAAFAAKTRGVPYGFDAEDFHDAETDHAAAQGSRRTPARILQSALLPGCAHLTASSPLIGAALQTSYGAHATTVLNVFPLEQAPPGPVAPQAITEHRPARVYWFSQTIGPGRGLEAAVATLARMRTPVELQLRGFAAPGYSSHLKALAAGRLARPIVFLPPGPPGEMARLAAGADLGLSCELPHPLNRDLCLTNKIFIYLLAGIPQLLTPTSAQRALAPDLGEAALLCDLAKPDEAAARLDSFFADTSRIAASRRTAWELARRRYCWQVEQEAFLRSIKRALG